MGRVLLTPAILLAFASLFWGANTVVARAVTNDIGPLSISFWRWLLAVVLLLPFTIRHVRKDWQVLVANAGFITVLGFSSVTAYTASIYIAAQTTQAINLSLIGSTVPAFAIAGSWLALGERVTWLQAIGFAVGFLGVGLVVCRGDLDVLINFRFATGDLVLLVGVALWAIYSVLLKIRALPVHSLSLLTATFVTGFLGTVPLFAWELAAGEPLRMNLPALLAIIYGAVFMSIGAYFCFTRGVAALGPNKANAFGYLAPLFSALLAVPLLDETFALYHGLSFALIVLGVYLATTKRPAATVNSLG